MTFSLKLFLQELATALDAAADVDQGIDNITLSTPGRRKQTIYARIRESGIGGEMILFYTPVGPFTQGIDCASLLELNVGTIYARAGLIDGRIVIVAGQLVEKANIPEAVTMLNEVSTLGDILENLLFGQDQF